MKNTSTILYTVEDTNGEAESFTPNDFNKIIESKCILETISIPLTDENESIKVPLIRGYETPYDSAVIDDDGVEHYIFYKKMKSEYIID